MAEEWYYSRQGDEFGPVSGARLKQLATSGKLHAGDLVWKVGMEKKKVQARTVKGLFGDSGVSPAARPQADSRIPPPPGKRPSKENVVHDDAPMDEEGDFDVGAPRKQAAKRKGGMPVWLWLVIGGGVFLFCCMGPSIGGYLMYNSWFGGPKFNTENAKKIKAGMSEKEVVDIIGPGRVINDARGGKEALRTLEWDDGMGMKLQMTFVNDKLLIAPIIPDFKDFKDLNFK